MLKIDNVSFSYNNKKVLKNIILNAKNTEITALLGKNGSGKTTLLKIINKFLKADSGQVFIDNKDINYIRRKDIAKLVGYCPQQTTHVMLTVYETVLCGRIVYNKYFLSKKDREIVDKTLEFTGLKDFSHRNLNQLSGGEFQKVIIARALAQKPKILLLDEPINNLDIKSQYDMMNLILKITKELEITTVIVLHDINIASKYADRFIILNNGCVMASGNQDILTSEVIEKAFNIKVEVKYINNNPFILPAT